MMKLIEIEMRLKPFNLQFSFERLVIYINLHVQSIRIENGLKVNTKVL